MAKAAAAKKPPTKSEILANVSAATNLPKKEVAAVLEASCPFFHHFSETDHAEKSQSRRTRNQAS